MNPISPIAGPSPAVLRYLAGEASLETTATEVAAQIMGASRQPPSELRTESPWRGANADTYEFSREDEVKLQALVVCVEAKLEPWRLELINKSAQEYLSTAGDSPFHKTMLLLAQDVSATLGEQHVPVVWSLAKGMQDRDGEDRSRQCIDEVQQYFQDTFVDTTWPACPRHPNHPLDCEGGSWHCPSDGAVIVPLGKLPRRPGQHS